MCAFLGMGGLEVQQKLIEAGINIPIILITAHGDIPMTVKAMKSGAFEFLTKPFRHQEFLGAIQQALNLVPKDNTPMLRSMPGLICLNGPVGMDRDLQLEMFEEALDELDRNDDLVNEVLEISLSDSSEEFEVLRTRCPLRTPNNRLRRIRIDGHAPSLQ